MIFLKRSKKTCSLGNTEEEEILESLTEMREKSAKSAEIDSETPKKAKKVEKEIPIVEKSKTAEIKTIEKSFSRKSKTVGKEKENPKSETDEEKAGESEHETIGIEKLGDSKKTKKTKKLKKLKKISELRKTDEKEEDSSADFEEFITKRYEISDATREAIEFDFVNLSTTSDSVPTTKKSKKPLKSSEKSISDEKEDDEETSKSKTTEKKRKREEEKEEVNPEDVISKKKRRVDEEEENRTQSFRRIDNHSNNIFSSIAGIKEELKKSGVLSAQDSLCQFFLEFEEATKIQNLISDAKTLKEKVFIFCKCQEIDLPNKTLTGSTSMSSKKAEDLRSFIKILQSVRGKNKFEMKYVISNTKKAWNQMQSSDLG